VAVMNILAIDTTGKIVSAALMNESALLGEMSLNSGQKTSVTLIPMIKHLLENVHMSISDLTHIACTSGPGSFTGLRIGASTAKAIAYALDIPIVAVPTLDALAYNVMNAQALIVPLMDARRQQVYTAFFECRGDDLLRRSDYMAMEIKDVLVKIRDILMEASQFDNRVVFLGDGATAYSEVIANSGLDLNYSFAALPLSLQRAASTAGLALRLASEGKIIESKSFIPFYLRLSQAERLRKR